MFLQLIEALFKPGSLCLLLFELCAQLGQPILQVAMVLYLLQESLKLFLCYAKLARPVYLAGNNSSS